MAQETNRQFYVIFSSRTEKSLTELITSYYEKVQKENVGLKLKKFSLLVPDKFKGRPTNRTFAVIDENIFESLKEEEEDIDAFKIEKLQMRPHFYPKPDENETADLFIMLPQFITLTDCQQYIMDRMRDIREYKIWNKSDYAIHIPQANRIEDKHAGKALIYFKGLQESRLHDIILTRLFINDTKWPGHNHEVRCFWRRPRKFGDNEGPNGADNTNGTSMTSETSDSDGKGNDTPKSEEKVSGNPWIDKKGKHQ